MLRREVYEKFYFFCELGCHDEARQTLLTEFENKTSLDAQSYNLLALSSYLKEDFEKALNYSKKALEIEPANLEAKNHLVLHLCQSSQYQAAENIITENLGPSLAGVEQKYQKEILSETKVLLANHHFETAKLYHSMGALSQAIETLESALSLNPKSWDLLKYYLKLLLKEKNYDLAYKALQNLQIYHEDQVELALYYGIIFFCQEKKEKAYEIWNSTSKKDQMQVKAKMFFELTQTQSDL